ncbi:LegC family aminotransferase [Carboxylicivirga sediminis]|uniref:GDP-perosamine synthase n=1 Tax=Carboxylicivirga sediminis TaxID=2006564 RepID=A0A941F5W0_9BACT|nr:LegC family aminotransferase [Carboxylicivirga sediminis]MBR8537396.1 LegC family aminotransferase [Carboxylicivirga sediminis]
MGSFHNVINKIRAIYNNSEGFIPLHAPVFNGNEKKYLNECIDSTFVSSVGKFVDRFENEMAIYTGAKNAVVCVNGTNALHLALQLVGVQQGDEVITQALTFIATANAISYCRAYPIFIDVDRDTLGLSPMAVKKWLAANAEIKKGACYNKVTGRRIKACVPMHTFGHPVRLDELIQVCVEYKLELVEDAAESLGSYYKGRHTGTYGKVGVLSFNGNKTITTGGGGMLLFNDNVLAQKAKHLTTQAKEPHAWEFSHDEIGYNLRMPNINAAIGCAQLEQIDFIIKSKRETASIYKEFFKELDIDFICEPKDCRSNYWLNAIVLKDKAQRDEFLKISNDNGVMTRPIWKLMSRLPMYKKEQKGDLENSIWLEDRIVNIPSSVIF